MSTVEPPEMDRLQEMDSAARRAFMKVAGVGALGLAYSHPMVETLHRSDRPGHDYDGTSPSESPSESPSNDSS